MEKEKLDKRLEEIGSKFCEVMMEAEAKQMEKVIHDWEKGNINEMAMDLESLDFLHEVASKICVQEEKK